MFDKFRIKKLTFSKFMKYTENSIPKMTDTSPDDAIKREKKSFWLLFSWWLLVGVVNLIIGINKLNYGIMWVFSLYLLWDRKQWTIRCFDMIKDLKKFIGFLNNREESL